MKHYKTFAEYIKGETITRYIPFFERCWKFAQRSQREAEIASLQELLTVAIKYNMSNGCLERLSDLINKRINEVNNVK